MEIETQQIYSEVYQIIELLGDRYINKLPRSLFVMLQEKRDITYNPIYSFDKPLIEQKIKKESIAMICLIYLNYWYKNEEEKKEILQMLKNNEDKHQEELNEKYNPDNLFKKDKVKIVTREPEETKEEVSMVQYKESILKKILNKIRSIFHR